MAAAVRALYSLSVNFLTDQEIATIVDPASKEHITRVAVESLLRKYTCVTL